MDNISISNFFIAKDDKLIFIYDFLNYWTFFVELYEVGEFNINDKKYLTINSIGEVPKEAPSDIFSKSDETNQIDFDDNLID